MTLLPGSPTWEMTRDLEALPTTFVTWHSYLPTAVFFSKEMITVSVPLTSGEPSFLHAYSGGCLLAVWQSNRSSRLSLPLSCCVRRIPFTSLITGVSNKSKVSFNEQHILCQLAFMLLKYELKALLFNLIEIQNTLEFIDTFYLIVLLLFSKGGGGGIHHIFFVPLEKCKHARKVSEDSSMSRTQLLGFLWISLISIEHDRNIENAL